MVTLLLDYEQWLLEDPTRLADFRWNVVIFSIIAMLAIAVIYLWYENRKKDREIHTLLDYIYKPIK